jgi:ATP-binding cassette subfamily B protein
VLDQGRVAERGDHASLLAAGGIYASLWETQQRQRRRAGDGAGDGAGAPVGAA